MFRPQTDETIFQAKNPIYTDMLHKKVAVGADGTEYPVHSLIPLDDANALYHAILEYQPNRVIEVGMAYGASSLAICTAFKELGGERSLISVDPFQSTDWKNIGVLNLQRSNLSHYHTLIEELDYFALPDLVKAGTTCDFAYIDGWHTFDYTLLDFFYIDKMLNTGGIVAFNDTRMPAVKKVMGYVTSHRKYMPIQINEPPPNRTSLRKVYLLAKGLIIKRDRYFKKLEMWEPAWNYYKRF